MGCILIALGAFMFGMNIEYWLVILFFGILFMGFWTLIIIVNPELVINDSRKAIISRYSLFSGFITFIVTLFIFFNQGYPVSTSAWIWKTFYSYAIPIIILSFFSIMLCTFSIKKERFNIFNKVGLFWIVISLLFLLISYLNVPGT
jgi:hypothetical protein